MVLPHRPHVFNGSQGALDVAVSGVVGRFGGRLKDPEDFEGVCDLLVVASGFG